MKPTIRAAQSVCEAMQARQVVVVTFDGKGSFAVVSYGATKRLCSEVAPLCDAIGEALCGGFLPAPTGFLGLSGSKR